MNKYISIIYGQRERKATPLGSCGRHTAICQPYLHNQYGGCHLKQTEPKKNQCALIHKGKLVRRKGEGSSCI